MLNYNIMALLVCIKDKEKVHVLKTYKHIYIYIYLFFCGIDKLTHCLWLFMLCVVYCVKLFLKKDKK